MTGNHLKVIIIKNLIQIPFCDCDLEGARPIQKEACRMPRSIHKLGGMAALALTINSNIHIYIYITAPLRG